LYGKEWNSAGNYRLLDEKSSGRNEFCQELPAPGRGIHQKNEILAGITISWTRNPPEEWNSAGITGSRTWIQTGKIKNLLIGNNSRNINSKGSLPRKTNFSKF
jgi:hypothetical protein